MKIHEYQAKNLLRDYGIPVPRGEVATTPEQARGIAAELAGRTVVKAQIHAGGRGKGGGVKLAASPDAAAAAARAILGMQLVTHQTGPEGKKVRAVLVEEACDPAKELYLSLVVDRSRGKECVVFMASEAGGMDIEQVAAATPEKIIKCAIHPAAGFSPFQARKLGVGLGLDAAQGKQFTAICRNLYRLFLEKDCSLIEINPLAITGDGQLLALDTKITFDDDALFRHPEIRELRDPGEEEPLEVMARDASRQLHQARRKRRLHGQRGGACDDDDGPDQDGGGRTRELPRRRRQRAAGPDRKGLPHPDLRSEREVHPHQHLRRGAPVRPRFRGADPGGWRRSR